MEKFFLNLMMVGIIGNELENEQCGDDLRGLGASNRKLITPWMRVYSDAIESSDGNKSDRHKRVRYIDTKLFRYEGN